LCLPVFFRINLTMEILERYTLSKSKKFQNLAKNPGIVPLAPIINPVTNQLPQTKLGSFKPLFLLEESICFSDEATFHLSPFAEKTIANKYLDISYILRRTIPCKM
ncbi:hypothetical protein L9F63_008165, partial [Diploptera punctata]